MRTESPSLSGIVSARNLVPNSLAWFFYGNSKIWPRYLNPSFRLYPRPKASLLFRPETNFFSSCVHFLSRVISLFYVVLSLCYGKCARFCHDSALFPQTLKAPLNKWEKDREEQSVWTANVGTSRVWPITRTRQSWNVISHAWHL